MFRTIFAFSLFCLNSFAFAQERPKSVSVAAAKMFVPAGYDDNDQVEVMVDIEFPNACYRMERTEVTRSENDEKIYIKTFALQYQGDGTACAEVITPYLDVAKIGLLKPGSHEIIVNPGPEEIRKTIEIATAVTSLPDDHIYAPVDYADLVEDKATKKKFLFLQGSYPLYLRGCAKIVEVRQIRDADNLLTVLPIMQMFYDDHCNSEGLQFKRMIPLDYPFETEGLLHVRKFNGSSFDKLVNR